LKKGLYEPSADSKITADKWGQWLSGYAPIQNEKGETVALLGIDMAASDIIAHRRSIGMPLLYMDIVLLPLLLLLSYITARIVSKPYKLLAIGMQRVVHGELDYRLPLAGSKTEIMFEKLFNNMLGMYDNVIKQFKKNKDDDFNN
jgi:methyl-accepting chemotaxis protein